MISYEMVRVIILVKYIRRSNEMIKVTYKEGKEMQMLGGGAAMELMQPTAWPRSLGLAVTRRKEDEEEDNGISWDFDVMVWIMIRIS